MDKPAEAAAAIHQMNTHRSSAEINNDSTESRNFRL